MQSLWQALLLSVTCPLCHSSPVNPFSEVHQRSYFECGHCGLVHMRPADRPDPVAERKRYETHQNDPKDPGYRQFLARLAEPLTQRLIRGAEGLDYGSGPGPAMSVLLEDAGFPMTIYDPFFAKDGQALSRKYAFITCSETAEHFFQPDVEFDRLNGLLKPGGWLGVMTEMLDDQVFDQWRYVRDQTHVAFYRLQTMSWIAGRFSWFMESPVPNVILFRKS